MPSEKTLYAFNEFSVGVRWRVVDDIVMGGRSEGHFAITERKHGRFYGHLSTENNGGFSSVHRKFDPPVDIAGYDRIRIRLRGDGSQYQFRVRATPEQRYQYTYEFDTTGDWEVIDIPLAQLYPVYRGNRLEEPNFRGDRLAEIAFLISNDRPQPFQLLLDRLELA
ncbi:CIA30 family protein [Lewinella sp. JB7]|uniref:CIA30 family protein n=1 Tax=Lewinella sp. JB7 TaxID=2962887 RepID=UPI0020C9CDCB|nr:CIA30 family protein [Lewinella sp. JB7]MCP9235744.1 CIA30 family protein [Lewinella sp. JB7]